MKTKLIFALATLIIINLGCKKKTEKPIGIKLPPGFSFVIVKNIGEGQLLINKLSQNVEMWHTSPEYSSNSIKATTVPTVSLSPTIYPYNVQSNAAWLSSLNGIKNFYIKIDGGKIDTLNLNIVKDKNGDFNFKEIKFNGKPVPFTDLSGYVWILKQ